MNWLFKACSKEDFLLNKYRKKASKLWQAPEKIAAINLEVLIRNGMAWNKQYAEWYTFQAINWISNFISTIKERLRADQFDPPETSAENNLQIARRSFFSTIQRNISSLNDYLIRGRGIIPSLTTSFEEVFKLSNAWHEEITKREAEYKTHNVVAQLSDGFQLISVPPEDITAEGCEKRMGHCVSSYVEDVESGKSNIYSIRDAQNNPHVTIEVTNNLLQMANGLHWEFAEAVQIKGKGNQPQPKYAKYVEEALDALYNNHLIDSVGGEQGWEDYLGFQKDQQAIYNRIEKLDQRTEVNHTNPVLKAHTYAKYGVDTSDLEEYLKTDSGQNFIARNQDKGTLSYAEYLINEKNCGDDLLEELSRLLQQYETSIPDDENEEKEKNENIQAINDTIKDVESKKFLASHMETEELYDVVSFWAKDYFINDVEVIDYYIDYYTQDITDALLETLDDDAGANMYPSNIYKYFKQHFDEEKRKLAYEQLKQRLQNISQKNNIQWPDMKYTGKWPSYMDASTAGFEEFVHQISGRFDHKNMSDQQLLQEIQKFIQNEVAEMQRHSESETKLEDKMAEWEPQLIQIVPGYKDLDYWDKRKLIVHFEYKKIIDTEVIAVAEQYVKMQKERQAVNQPNPQQLDTTNS